MGILSTNTVTKEEEEEEIHFVPRHRTVSGMKSVYFIFTPYKTICFLILFTAVYIFCMSIYVSVYTMHTGARDLFMVDLRHFSCHYYCCSRSCCYYFDSVPNFVAVAASAIAYILNYFVDEVDDTHIDPSFPSRPCPSYLSPSVTAVVGRVASVVVDVGVVDDDALRRDINATVVAGVVILADMNGTLMLGDSLVFAVAAYHVTVQLP